MKSPEISVIMGIYNCETTLRGSLDSLLNQTYQNFEIILCDDGSEDGTYDLAKSYLNKYPDKITLLRNKENIGLNYTLNKCLAFARGRYIARMDGDDLSLPSRFKKQIDFLNDNPDIAIVSSSMVYFDAEGDWGRSNPILEPRDTDIIKSTPFAHAASMVREEAYSAVNGYTVDDKLLRVEDYHLWVKMYAEGFKGYNMEEPLYKMRNDEDAIARRTFKNRVNESYVKILAVRMLSLPLWYVVFAIRPILVGVLPQNIYILLHRKRIGNK